jgi:hypothetical protein
LTVAPQGLGNGAPVVQQTCMSHSRSASVSSAQFWILGPFGGFRSKADFAKVTDPSARTPLWLAQPLTKGHKATFFCLDVTDFKYAIGAVEQTWGCQRPRQWNQLFVIVPYTQVSCDVVGTKLCGLVNRP